MDERQHGGVRARWICWGLAALVLAVDAVFMFQHWTGMIGVPPGAHGYMVVAVILLGGAGYVLGDEQKRAVIMSGLQYVMAETGSRLAVIEANTAELRNRPHLPEERIAEIIQAEVEKLRREMYAQMELVSASIVGELAPKLQRAADRMADLEQEIAENRVIAREARAVVSGEANGAVKRLPRSRHADE